MPVERERAVKAIEDFAESMALEGVHSMSNLCRELGTLIATLTELKITAPEATEICKKAMYRMLRTAVS
jgi:hypothetical protein